MRIRDRVAAAAQGLGTGIGSLFAGSMLFTASALSIGLIPVGIGALTTPTVLRGVRAYANRHRALATEWGGVPVTADYRPVPARDGLIGRCATTFALLRDPATWRDLRWLLADMTAGVLAPMLSAALILQGVFGYVLMAGVWRPIHQAGGTHWYTFVPVDSQGTATLAALVGTALIAIGIAIAPVMRRVSAALTRAGLDARPASPTNPVQAPVHSALAAR
ncbi:sensor domain-containing protein [Streptomyces hoynatensis]|uniref:Putative sensor domain-containing protein n=1 Tax=Streptomyces hoynatensis TaxID=1141874 RepID=A0A3A9YMA3_9ACTN|nr:sensor domain-containing protein [Streptomyces hoynatensis]RKN37498.1 hypothetical protein D7294_27550 [Streptomyces hoynatensis]